MAFKFNEYHLGGSGGVIEPITIKQNGTYNATDGVDGYAPITVDVAGGKDPILGELVVTENGVYDEPVIGGGLEPIIWDGVVGDRVTAKSGEEVMYTKLTDKVLSVEDLVGSTIVTNNEQKIIVDSTTVLEMSDVILATELVVVAPKANATFSMGSETVTFPEAGIYFFGVAPAFYVTSFTLASAPSTPADGWNKVTVNVAGDIIDVPELPTENIEEGKIYRVTTVGDPLAWIAGIYGDGTDEVALNMSVAELITEMFGIHVTSTPIHFFDETLPDTFEPADMANGIVPLHVDTRQNYVYMSMDGTPENLKRFNYDYGGSVDSVDGIDLTVPAMVYAIRGESSTTYGIPNANPVKRLVDGAWVELA